MGKLSNFAEWFRDFATDLLCGATVPDEPKVDSAELLAFKKAQFQAVTKKLEDEASESYNKHKRWADEENSKCPKCGNKKVVDNIRRLQGEINGSFGGSLFGFGGSMHGSMDTNEVNQCTNPECGHQWKKSVVTYPSSSLDTYLLYVRWAIEHSENIAKVTYDPNDIKSPYNSLDEARIAEINRAENYKTHALEHWTGTCIEVIQELAKSTRRYTMADVEKNFPAKKMKTVLGLKYASEMLSKTE
jgi:DNA-directed RNA polymerase subunit M/transcription elongation factor TFIIS